MSAFEGNLMFSQDVSLFGIEQPNPDTAALSFNSDTIARANDRLDWAETVSRLQRLGVSAANIETCRRLSHENGSTLSRELIARGLLNEELYYKSLAADLGITFAGKIDPNSLIVLPGHSLATLRKASVIKALAPGGESLLLSAPDDHQLSVLIRSLRRFPGLRDTIRLTAPLILDRALVERLTDDSLREAVFNLRNGTPAFSASQVATGLQGFIGGLLLVLVCLFACLYPSISLLLCHLFASIIFASCVLMRVHATSRFPIREGSELAGKPEGPYPIYTVLVALYREAEVVAQLVSQLMALNWPASRLEIMIACEADDETTIDQLRRTIDPSRIRIIAVPKLGPQTKPRALSFALQAARGEFVAIYDAEDRPHPDQLMEAYGRFQREPMSTACLQAPLVVTNHADGFLARLFSFEYSALFGGLLPYLASTGKFIPLGGTSNHFRCSALQAVGGWDPFNVTEDADLGTRFSRLGYTCGMISKPTFEDAPKRFKQWRPQRVRWFKGWLQTWLVHMRDPGRLMREFGVRDFLRFQLLTMGMFLSALVYPSMLIVVVWNAVQMITTSIEGMSLLAMALFVVDSSNVILGHLVFSALGAKVERVRGIKPSRFMALRLPVYWTLLSAAAWGAVWELIRRPHHWNKTEHFPTAS
jgi:cellulose synthase/poly-beta-1,6-N-acetylglucosamine synthase-like glycosyltransferase